MIAFLLPQASTMAPKVDELFNFILWTSVVSFLLIVIGKIFFLVKFWRKNTSEHTTPLITGHTLLESSVAVLLTVWVMIIFWWGWVDYKELRAAPANAMEISIVARQWSWEMVYNDGRKLSNELIVPQGRPVKLIMTSKDVLHSFYVPAFRVKQDIIPNTYTSLWFEATQAGEFPIYCAEYCGTAHSKMLAKVRVLEPQEYEEWELEALPPIAMVAGSAPMAIVPITPQDLAGLGKNVFNAKGCVACHSVKSGEVRIGPSLANIFGKTETLADGSKVQVDENYIRESLMEPNAKVVKGFQPLMPTMKGQLTEDEIMTLIQYIKSLKGGN